MSDLSEKVTKVKSKVTEQIAHAAGDRRSEAKNAVEAETGQQPDDPTLDAVEQDKRAKHHDIQETSERD